MTGSALGASMAGAGSLIGAVSSLIPSSQSTKGRTNTKATGSSSTDASQLNLEESELSRMGLGLTDTNQTKSSTGKESTQANSSTSSTTSSRSQSKESFSGQKNSSSSQTLLDDKAIMRVMNMMLQGDENSIGGLQALAQGERTAGIFNSSTNQMLTSDLLTRVAGEAARLGAKTVQTQDLGATTTSTDSATSSDTSGVTDAVTSAMSSLQDILRGQESNITSSVDKGKNSALQLAEQDVLQSSESDSVNSTKSKSNPFGGTYICTFLAKVLPDFQNAKEFEALREFKEVYLIPFRPVGMAKYGKIAPPIVAELEKLPEDVQVKEALRVRTNYIIPAAEAYEEGDFDKAIAIYWDMVYTLQAAYIKGE